MHIKTWDRLPKGSLHATGSRYVADNIDNYAPSFIMLAVTNLKCYISLYILHDDLDMFTESHQEL